MRIAVVVPAVWQANDPSRFSVNLTPYIEAILGMGHEALLVCHADSEYQVNYQVLAVPAEQLECGSFWRELKLDAALTFTWLGRVKVLQALHEADVFTVAKGDSDGMLSVRLFPWHNYQIMLGNANTPFQKMHSLYYWMKRYLFLSTKSDAEVIASIAASDYTSVETHSAKSHLEQILVHYDQRNLINKLCVLPHLVADTILTAPICTERAEKIVAIGRWDTAQKDAPLLAKALEEYLKSRPNSTVELIGRGSQEIFAPLQRKFAQVSCLGAVSRTEITRHLSDARVLLMTSRWESFHIAAHEALCLGATVVGPDVIPIPDICRQGEYGTLAAGRRPKQIADALEHEMKAWECGQRDPRNIATFWRPQLSAQTSIWKILQMEKRDEAIAA